VNAARRCALDICELKRPWNISLYKTDKLVPVGEAREILGFARAQARKRAPNLKHPLVCIDVIEEGIVSGPRAGLWKVHDAMYFVTFTLLLFSFCKHILQNFLFT
jgi:enoyl-CoA hydratase/3-hydroxyacyl-CoA dehydrogenase